MTPQDLEAIGLRQAIRVLNKVWNDKTAEYGYKFQKGDSFYYGDEAWAKRIAEHYNIHFPTEGIDL